MRSAVPLSAGFGVSVEGHDFEADGGEASVEPVACLFGSVVFGFSLEVVAGKDDLSGVGFDDVQARAAPHAGAGFAQSAQGDLYAVGLPPVASRGEWFWVDRFRPLEFCVS